MIDEIFDRSYQSGRAELNAGIDRAATALGSAIINAIGGGLSALHRLEWNAPWKAEVKRPKCN